MKEVQIDRIGAIASGVCAVHCILTGVAIGFLSFGGLGFLGSSIADGAFLLIAMAIAAIALVHGKRKHHSYKPSLIFAIGVAALIAGHFVFKHEHTVGNSRFHLRDLASVILAVGGGLCLVAFHYMNMRMAASCRCDHCATGE